MIWETNTPPPNVNFCKQIWTAANGGCAVADFVCACTVFRVGFFCFAIKK